MSEEASPLINIVNLFIKNYRSKYISEFLYPKIDLSLHNISSHLILYDSHYIIPCRFSKNSIERFLIDYPDISFIHNCDRKVTLILYKLNLIPDPQNPIKDSTLELEIESFDTDFAIPPIPYDKKGKEIINEENLSLKTYIRKLSFQSKDRKGSEGQITSNVQVGNRMFQQIEEVNAIQIQIYKEKNKENPKIEKLPIPKLIPGRDFPLKEAIEKKPKDQSKTTESKPNKSKKPRAPKDPNNPNPTKERKAKNPSKPRRTKQVEKEGKEGKEEQKDQGGSIFQ